MLGFILLDLIFFLQKLFDLSHWLQRYRSEPLRWINCAMSGMCYILFPRQYSPQSILGNNIELPSTRNVNTPQYLWLALTCHNLWRKGVSIYSPCKIDFLYWINYRLMFNPPSVTYAKGLQKSFCLVSPLNLSENTIVMWGWSGCPISLYQYLTIAYKSVFSNFSSSQSSKIF